MVCKRSGVHMSCGLAREAKAHRKQASNAPRRTVEWLHAPLGVQIRLSGLPLLGTERAVVDEQFVDVPLEVPPVRVLPHAEVEVARERGK